MTTKYLVTDEEIFTLLTGKVSFFINKNLSNEFKKNDLNITTQQWSILHILWKKDGCPQNFLAESSLRDKASTTRIIDSLVTEGLIERKSHKNDRRINLIFLTKYGKSIKEKVQISMQETIKKAIMNIDEDKIREFKKVLKIIYSNLEK